MLGLALQFFDGLSRCPPSQSDPVVGCCAVATISPERKRNRMFSVSDDQVQQVMAAKRDYDNQFPYYDDIFRTAGDRMRQQEFATKEDVAVIAFWKAINLSTSWVREFLNADPDLVRSATRQAFHPGISDLERLEALEGLRGFKSARQADGGAIASTVLCCWNPYDFAVTDIRAREALRGLVGHNATLLLDYWQAVRIIRDAAKTVDPDVSARDVDKALFTLAGNKKRHGSV